MYINICIYTHMYIYYNVCVCVNVDFSIVSDQIVQFELDGLKNLRTH